jgi:hypothetical protein
MGAVALVVLAALGVYGYVTHRTESEVASTVLIGAAFLFGSSLAMLFPRVYLAYLFPSLAWILGGVFGLMGVFGAGWGSWPDWIFASGIANLIGGAIGFVISKVARHLKKERL